MCLTRITAAQTETVEELALLLEGFQTLRANVSQLIVEDGGVLEQSEVRMALKRPSGFYWETVEPFAELIVTDGVTLWNYQPELEQVVIQDWRGEDAELAAQLLAGDIDALARDYRIQQSDSPDGFSQWFLLTPLADDSLYRSIALGFQVDTTILSIRVFSNTGQETVWNFHEVEQDSPIDDGMFRFTAPAGMEIIDHRSGAAADR